MYGPARDRDDLEGPDDAAGVGRTDRDRGRRVEPDELVVQVTGAVPLGPLLQLGADRGVRAGEVEPVEQRPHVEPRPADDDAPPSAGGDRRQVRAPRRLVPRDRGVLGDVEDVELVVRDPAPLLRRQLGGADVHAAVELHGVGIDDLAVEGRGEGEAEVGLAGRRRADDRDHQRGHAVRRHAVRRHAVRRHAVRRHAVRQEMTG